MELLRALGPGDRRDLFWLFLAALAVLAAGFGLREPWPADEPRFVLVAKQMVESGDYLFPHRGSELYPDKPPLYFWLLAASYGLVGSWRWSFLLPSLLAALATLGLTYDLGRRLWSPRAGLWAAIAVLASIQFVYQAKRAQIDPTLTFLTTLGFYGLCRHALLGPHWRWYWAGCLAAGLGVISKGVGFLPLLALLPLAAMRRSAWPGLATAQLGDGRRWAGGGLAFLAPILLWLLAIVGTAVVSGDPEQRAYLQNILFHQTAKRYVDPSGHHHPPWYFLQVVALFWLPFSLALPWLWRVWREAWRARDARVWLPLAWALLVLGFFSLSPGKRDMYILPALPALALAAAPYLDGLTARAGFRWTLWLFLLALGGLLFAAGASALLTEPRFASAFVQSRGLGDAARSLWIVLAAVGAAILALTLILRPRRVLTAAAAALIGLWLSLVSVAYPVLDGDSSARKLMARARELSGPEVTIGLIDWKEQNLLQAIGPVTEFGFRQPRSEQLRRGQAWLAADPERRRLLLPEAAPAVCSRFDHGRAELVGTANRRRWWLLDADAVEAACP